MSKARVLVTRSEPGASETADRLSAAGYLPIIEPVFTIEPLAAEVPEFDALAFTSANGARQFAALSPRRDDPVFCVGARTAEAAREVGFANVTSADGDASTLVTAMARLLPKQSRLLHAGNEDSRGDIAGQMRSKGYSATFLPIFRAVARLSPGPVLVEHLAGRAAFDAVLIHSPRGASILAGFAKGSSVRLDVVAISGAAATPLGALARRTEIAAAPNEPALLSALARLVSG